jgi:hypothetical protein
VPHIDTLNGSVASNASSLVVDNVSYWQVRDTGIEAANFQCFVVTAVTTDTSTLTITRVGTWSSGIADAVELINTGSAHEEGADFEEPVSTKETMQYNYLQIFRETVGMTEMQRLTKMYGGADWPYQVRKKGTEHGRKLERGAWFNERSYVTSGTHPYGTVRGIKNWISTHSNTSFGAITLKKLDDELRACAEEDQVSADKYYLFTSLAVKGIISRLAASSTTEMVKTGTKVFGINISTYNSPALDVPLNIVAHPEFTQITGMAAAGFIIRMNPSRIRYVRASGNGINLDTHIRVNVQDPGETIRVDEWYTCMGLELHWEKLHNYLDTIQEAA